MPPHTFFLSSRAPLLDRFQPTSVALVETSSADSATLCRGLQSRQPACAFSDRCCHVLVTLGRAHCGNGVRAAVASTLSFCSFIQEGFRRSPRASDMFHSFKGLEAPVMN